MKPNKKINDIYEEYRDEMARTLGMEEYAPELFGDKQFVNLFERKVERLDALINLYASLISAHRN